MIRILSAGFILLAFILYSCASQKPPTGGPKDKQPPILINSFPKDQSANFHGSYIRLQFDEIIDVKNLKGELIISPDPNLKYKEKYRSKGLIVNLLDSLRPNTTYTFNFGNSISDITEKNVPENLSIAFSTGPVIDSLYIKGRIVNNLNNEPEKSNVIIGLYAPSDTLDVTKHQPEYYTKVDETGYFVLNNLPARQFEIYAITDKNKNRTFDSRTELLGFYGSTINSSEPPDSLILRLVDQNFDSAELIRTFEGSNYFKLDYSRGLKSFEVKADEVSFSFFDKNSSVVLFPSFEEEKEIQVSWVDSLGRSSDSLLTISLDPVSKEFDKKSSLNSTPPNNSKILPSDSIIFWTNIPPASFLTDSVFYQGKPDTTSISKLELRPNTIPWVFYPDPKQETFGILYKKGSIISVTRDTIPSKQFRYGLKKPENFGQVEGEVKSDEQCFIVQVLNEKFQIVKESKNSKRFVFKGLDPGKYQLRALIDRNCNGVYDQGDYRSKELPERFHFYDELMQLKANWIQTDKVLTF